MGLSAEGTRRLGRFRRRQDRQSFLVEEQCLDVERRRDREAGGNPGHLLRYKSPERGIVLGSR
jgi:hypothetical protein